MPGRSRRPTKSELEEDQFVEWILKAADYLKQRAQLFIVGAAAIALVVSVFVYVKSSQADAKKEAAELLGQALIRDEAGQPAESMLKLGLLTDSYAGTPAGAQGTIILANRYFAQGEYAEAEKLYRSYLDEPSPVDILLFASRSGIASCYEAKEEFQLAASEYLAYAADNVGSMQSTIALMNAARCQRLAGNREARKDILRRVTREYPKSPVAARAQNELNML